MMRPADIHRVPYSDVEGLRAPMIWRDALRVSTVVWSIAGTILVGGIQPALDYAFNSVHQTPLLIGFAVILVVATSWIMSAVSSRKSARTNLAHAEALDAIRSSIAEASGVSITDGAIANIVEGRRLVLSSGDSVWSEPDGDDVVFLFRPATTLTADKDQ